MALRESHLTDVESFESTIAEPRSTDESTGHKDRATELAYLQQTPPGRGFNGTSSGHSRKSPRALSWKPCALAEAQRNALSDDGLASHSASRTRKQLTEIHTF